MRPPHFCYAPATLFRMGALLRAWELWHVVGTFGVWLGTLWIKIILLCARHISAWPDISGILCLVFFIGSCIVAHNFTNGLINFNIEFSGFQKLRSVIEIICATLFDVIRLVDVAIESFSHQPINVRASKVAETSPYFLQVVLRPRAVSR